jgi:hypothetical protein
MVRVAMAVVLDMQSSTDLGRCRDTRGHVDRRLAMVGPTAIATAVSTAATMSLPTVSAMTSAIPSFEQCEMRPVLRSFVSVEAEHLEDEEGRPEQGLADRDQDEPQTPRMGVQVVDERADESEEPSPTRSSGTPPRIA